MVFGAQAAEVGWDGGSAVLVVGAVVDLGPAGRASAGREWALPVAGAHVGGVVGGGAPAGGAVPDHGAVAVGDAEPPGRFGEVGGGGAGHLGDDRAPPAQLAGGIGPGPQWERR